MAKKQRWSDLSPRQRRIIPIAGAIQISLLLAALRDLHHRGDDEVNGDRRLWTAACFVNFVGPLAYFAFGRRR
jgi:hypothetical protein